MRLPVVVCIDVEPDLREIPVDATPTWEGFERLVPEVAPLRARLAEASGRPAALAWFLRADPQIAVGHGSAGWLVERHGPTFDRFVADGDELGLHPHCWRWTGDHWCSDHADPDWIEECVTTGLDTYEAAFGRPAPSYRGGDRYFDAAVFALLRRRGVCVDLTLEPGMPTVAGLVPTEHAEGSIPGVPPDRQRPYFPDPVDPLASGPPTPLLALPLTAGPTFTDGDPAAGVVRTAPIRLTLPPRAFRVAMDAVLTDPGRRHLAFAMRSDAARHPVFWRWAVENLDALAARLGADAAWCTPSDAATRVGSAPDPGPPGPSPGSVEVAVAALDHALFEAELMVLHLDDARAGVEARLDDALAECRRLGAVAAELADAEAESRARLDAVLATRWWRLRRAAGRVSRRLHPPAPGAG